MIDIGADLQRAFDEGYEKGKADRPQGEWIDEHEDGHGSWVGTCNQCGEENHVDNYCPNCGCRMKGADDE